MIYRIASLGVIIQELFANRHDYIYSRIVDTLSLNKRGSKTLFSVICSKVGQVYCIVIPVLAMRLNSEL
jgi:hypothetical protein